MTKNLYIMKNTLKGLAFSLLFSSTLLNAKPPSFEKLCEQRGHVFSLRRQGYSNGDLGGAIQDVIPADTVCVDFRMNNLKASPLLIRLLDDLKIKCPNLKVIAFDGTVFPRQNSRNPKWSVEEVDRERTSDLMDWLKTNDIIAPGITDFKVTMRVPLYQQHNSLKRPVHQLTKSLHDLHLRGHGSAFKAIRKAD